ncbi:hypothetical protein BGX20_009871 [Mortierella sp. AD010]|nr:hypothetical protein BGX20_009871 [Mortierella sp. AD010]
MVMYQNILEGAAAALAAPKPQPLVTQKHCSGCAKQIFQAKVFVEPGKPSIIYCEKCYVEKFAKGKCPTCLRPVMSKTDPYITHNKQTWHAACFKCFKCYIDVASKPMVDLRGRPCCEECLMSQAGAGNHPSPPLQENEPPFRNRSTPGNRSITSSPGPSPSSQYKSTRDLSDRLQLNLSSLDTTVDNGYTQQQAHSPVSTLSTSSQSSLGGSFRQTPSSGYTSGTSSTYSSLGRKRSDSSVPSVVPSVSDANMLKPDQNSSAGSPPLSYRRPNSALSIHSYASSRTNSPAPNNDSDNIFKSVSDYPDSIGRDQEGIVENTSESTINGLRQSKSRSLIGLDDVGSTLSPSGSRPETPSYKSTPAQDKYPELTSVPEADLAKKTAGLSVSTTERVQRVEIQIQPQTQTQPQYRQEISYRPVLGRARSRSSVPAPISASVKARTEAYMNQAQATSPSTPRSASQTFNTNRTSGAFNSSTLPSKQQQQQQSAPKTTAPANGKESKESKPALSELEPERPSLYRHGRQRSNTVGEAISFPVVSVADTVLSPTQMRKANIPENHCLKCLERVTENGVKLQNGDRYHIGCFLCHGCKQVFTESEFHIVLGRPYHPGCVSMAGPTSNMGVITKCQQCHKIITNKSIRFAGMNYHPQCFTCSHCSKVLTSTSKFFEVDGQVECEKCCDERDAMRLPPKIVPVPRATDHFPMPNKVKASADSNSRLESSGPGMMAAGNAQGNLSRSGSGASGYGSPTGSPGSPTSTTEQNGNGLPSPVLVMTSPLSERSSPPALTSFFGTRTRPLPKFGGVTNCPRCQQPVGVMDQVPGPKNEKWHKKCLNCKDCKKVLDSSALTRGEGEAFCRGCYNKTRSRV